MGFAVQPARRINARMRLSQCALVCVLLSQIAGAANAAAQKPNATETLRGAAQRSNLLMGAAADAGYLSEPLYSSTLAVQYSQLEPENEMKFGPIHPEPTTYDYAAADALVAFAQAMP